MSRSKRHHYVQRAYLTRFGLNDTVSVRWRGRQGRLLSMNVKNVALENHFYETEGLDGQKSTAVEDLLTNIENEAFPVIKEIDESGRLPPLDDDKRYALALYLAVQIARTPETRARLLFTADVAEYAGDRNVDEQIVAEYLEQEHLGFRPTQNETQAALTYIQMQDQLPTKTDAIYLMLGTVERLAFSIASKFWSLEIARKPRLITSDTPVIMWRTPSTRDRFEGVGLDNAEEVRFPLSPGAQIVMGQGQRTPVVQIEPARVRACNADMARGCHRFILGHPSRPKALLDAPLARIDRPTLRFSMAPGIQQNPDGTEEHMGDVLHLWVQRQFNRRG